MHHSILLTIAFLWITSAENTINLPQGMVQGTWKSSFGGRKFLAFEGIPFAKPPLGNLRFEAPEPADRWNGTLVADKTYTCLQYFPIPMLGFTAGTEDCLYLYVYVPRSSIDGNENLDVVAYIHGGGFMFGDPVQFGSPDYIMDTDVIFVSFNYRLSILGFLSTEDSVVPGNNGLKDQTLALNWIKENIKYFGGNPNSVTLYGLSAGAVSAHLHYMSPMSKGLFHRGFSQSGSALHPWAICKKPLRKARIIAAYFSCPKKSTRKMIECLKRQKGQDLIASSKILTVFMDNIPFLLFGPVVEKWGKQPFVADHPYKLLQERKVYDVPWVSSNVMDEGIFPTNLIAGLGIWDKIDDWTGLMPYILELQYTVDRKDLENVMKKIRFFYFNDEPLSDNNLYSMVKLMTDRMYKVDSEKAVRLQAMATKSPVFYYLYTYQPEKSLQIPGVPRLKGVAHGDDGLLFTAMSFMGIKQLAEGRDKEMAHLFVNFLYDYARGNVGTFNGVKWLPIDPESAELNVLNISSPSNFKMQKMAEIAPQKFWDSLPIHENAKRIISK